jgi:hypothetical protein
MVYVSRDTDTQGEVKVPATSTSASQYANELRAKLEGSNLTNTNMDVVTPWNAWQFDLTERVPTANSKMNSTPKVAIKPRIVAQQPTKDDNDNITKSVFSGVVTLSSLNNPNVD